MAKIKIFTRVTAYEELLSINLERDYAEWIDEHPGVGIQDIKISTNAVVPGDKHTPRYFGTLLVQYVEPTTKAE